jgi:hypothetical protein
VSTTVQRETFKFNPEASPGGRAKGSAARNCSVVIILRHPSVHDVRTPGNINALLEAIRKLDKKLFG